MTPSAGLNIIPVGRFFGIRLHGFRKKETRASHKIKIGTSNSHHPSQITNAAIKTNTHVIVSHWCHPYLVSVKNVTRLLYR